MVGLILLVTAAVYWPAKDAHFVWDDEVYITKNPHFQAGRESGIGWTLTSTYSANWHPLTWISHQADMAVFGLNPRAHRLVNLTFHLINTGLLFVCLRVLTRRLWPSVFVAALFALHPLHVESVAWVAERKDLLSTFFLLLAVLSYVHYRRRPAPARYFLVLTLFAFGLMAKPMVVTFPFLLLLLDFWPLDRLQGRIAFPSILWLVREKIPFFALTVGSSIITFAAQAGSGAVAPVERNPIPVAVMNALVAYVTYLRKTIWPSDLAAFYPYPPSGIPGWKAAGAFVFLTAVSYLAIHFRKRRPYLLAGWLWYVGMLVPVIGLVQVGAQAMADRYTYVPLLGIFIIIAWGTDELTRKWRRRTTTLFGAAVVLLVILAGLTRRQAGFWRDERALWRHALEVTDGNWMAHSNLGVILRRENKEEEAIVQLRAALKTYPEHLNSLNALGKALRRLGRNQEAIDVYQKALDIMPDADTYYSLGNALMDLNRDEAALKAFRRAVEMKPDAYSAYNNMGITYRKLGRLQEAVEAHRESLRIRPDHAPAHLNLGLDLLLEGDKEGAAAEIEVLKKLDLPKAQILDKALSEDGTKGRATP